MFFSLSTKSARKNKRGWTLNLLTTVVCSPSASALYLKIKDIFSMNTANFLTSLLLLWLDCWVVVDYSFLLYRSFVNQSIIKLLCQDSDCHSSRSRNHRDHELIACLIAVFFRCQNDSFFRCQNDSDPLYKGVELLLIFLSIVATDWFFCCL
jgi:hypothetical protein